MVDMGESPSFVLRFHPDGDDQVQVSRGHIEIVPLNLRRSVAFVSICVLLSVLDFRFSAMKTRRNATFPFFGRFRG